MGMRERREKEKQREKEGENKREEEGKRQKVRHKMTNMNLKSDIREQQQIM